MILRQLWNKIAAALIGAAAGMLLALIIELTGHSSWYALALLGCAIVPSVYFYFADLSRITAFRNNCIRFPLWSKLGLVLLMIAITVALHLGFEVNPRDINYLPLLVPVIASAIIFGFGPGLFAVVLTAIAADYFFALPEYSFSITEWEDAVGLAAFAILGALAALVIDGFLDFPD